ncbi:4'-phosphopantetheinyl transferase superfamily protein [Buttiauxella warmboldiae]|uniref:4'-phosphopantetheinyl transferase superfamily protein n=1 Tax=Buttiauxella warmboldiae TaxID=82993 RepID=A0A3N5EFK6_9ENTR|nr:4'-phosphopantetheinyl transferase superfamily protein [Buttiauxella warmboldiae]RPH30002.1 4'-phosphopantetheinyl transferase superfamily protein [Buttiauxella warmboldiae]
MVANGYRLAFAEAACLASEELATRWLTPELLQQAPAGRRRNDWIAARVLLAQLLDNGPLPCLEKTAQGKPWHPALPAFNISNSGSGVAVLVGDGNVGCDLEQIRPRARFMAIARHSFAAHLCEWLAALPQCEQIPQFWRLWTAHEAVLKQRGGTVWQMSQLDLPLHTLCPPDRYLQHVTVGDWLIACCGEQPFAPGFTPVPSVAAVSGPHQR